MRFCEYLRESKKILNEDNHESLLQTFMVDEVNDEAGNCIVKFTGDSGNSVFWQKDDVPDELAQMFASDEAKQQGVIKIESSVAEKYGMFESMEIKSEPDAELLSKAKSEVENLNEDAEMGTADAMQQKVKEELARLDSEIANTTTTTAGCPTVKFSCKKLLTETIKHGKSLEELFESPAQEIIPPISKKIGAEKEPRIESSISGKIYKGNNNKEKRMEVTKEVADAAQQLTKGKPEINVFHSTPRVTVKNPEGQKLVNIDVKPATENKGNAAEGGENFEQISDVNSELSNLIRNVAGITGKISKWEVSKTGGQNNRRSLYADKNSVLINNGANTGATLADWIISTNKGDIYVSIKNGTTLTFINGGITTSNIKGETLEDKIGTLISSLTMNQEGIEGKQDFVNFRNNKIKKEPSVVNIDKLANIRKFVNTAIFGNNEGEYVYLNFPTSKKNKPKVELINAKFAADVAKSISSAYYLPPSPSRRKLIIEIENSMIRNMKIEIREKNGPGTAPQITLQYHSINH